MVTSFGLPESAIAVAPSGAVPEAAFQRVERFGNATLYLADCRDVLPYLPDVEAVVTDPPYGKDLRNNGGQPGSKRGSGSYHITGDRDPTLGREVLDWARQHSSAIAAFADPALPWTGHWRSRLVWNKGGAVGGGGDTALCWKQTWELLQVWNLGPLYGGRDEAVLRFPATPALSREHPAAKPVELLAYIIRKLTGEGALVADPFMGSGSTGVAAVTTGRRFVGIELDPRHFDTACRRIAAAEHQPSLLGDAA